MQPLLFEAAHQNDTDQFLSQLQSVESMGAMTSQTINATNDDGNTVLHIAVFNGNLKIVNALLALGSRIDVNQTNKHQQTALHLAARRNGYIKIAKVLCDHPNICVNAKDRHNGTAFSIAIGRKDIELAQLLLRYGVDIVNIHQKKIVRVETLLIDKKQKELLDKKQKELFTAFLEKRNGNMLKNLLDAGLDTQPNAREDYIRNIYPSSYLEIKPSLSKHREQLKKWVKSFLPDFVAIDTYQVSTVLKILPYISRSLFYKRLVEYKFLCIFQKDRVPSSKSNQRSLWASLSDELILLCSAHLMCIRNEKIADRFDISPEIINRLCVDFQKKDSEVYRFYYKHRCQWDVTQAYPEQEQLQLMPSP